MRRLPVFVFVLLLAATANGQWLEQTVWLPDSITGLEGSSHILFNPANHHAYIGGDADALQIFDYATREKVGFIDSLGVVTTMFLCPGRQRVYVGAEDWDGVAVLDAVTDSVRTIVGLPSTPACGVYNPQLHKAYVGAYRDAALFVLDPGPDTLLATIQLADEVVRIVYDSATNRVFGMAYDGSTHGIKVIDCAGDTLAGVLPTMDDYCVDLAFDPATRRLYCLGKSFTTELAEVWVYDVDALSLLDTLALPESWSSIDGRLLLNPATGRLYAGYMSTERTDDPEDSVAVIDCPSNTIAGFIEFPEGSEVRNWALNRTDNKVYICTWDLDSVAVLAAPDSITSWVRTDASVSCVGWNPENDELLMPDDDDMLNVVAGANDSVLARVDYHGFHARALRWNPAGDKLYAFGNGVMVIGPQNNVLKWVRGGSYPGATLEAAYSPELNRFYFPDWLWQPRAVVFDCNGDSVLRVRPLPVMPYYPPFLVPGQHKVYWPGQGDTTAVYDVYSDSVVKVRTGLGTHFVHNPRTGMLYGRIGYDLSIRVIDPRTDSVIEFINCPPISDLVANPADNELYAGGALSDAVYVVNCATNTVEDTIALPQIAHGLYWYEPLNKLYVGGDSSVMVVDCRTRSLTRLIPVGPSSPRAAVFAERNDKLWVGVWFWPQESIYVIQCHFDSVVAKFSGSVSADMVWNSIDNRVYAADGNVLRVFRDDPSSVEAGPLEAAGSFFLKPLANPAAGTVRLEYGLPGREPGLLGVFDALGRQVWTGSAAVGNRVVIWPGTDRQGRRVPAGVYLARFEVGRNRTTAKVVLR